MNVRYGNRRNGDRKVDGEEEGAADPMCIISLPPAVLCNTHDSCGAQRGCYRAHVLLPNTLAHVHCLPILRGCVLKSPAHVLTALCLCLYVHMCGFSPGTVDIREYSYT